MREPNTQLRAFLFAGLSIVCCCHALPANAQSRAPVAGGPLPGATYASLQELPDWSGWWHVVPADPALGAQPPLLRLLSDPQPPFIPQLVPRVRGAVARMLREGGREYCKPPRFVGFQHGDGFEDTLELLFTPGRVTITNELGLIRRIYTDGRSLPEDPDETYTGTSIGRWEGDTLIVETVGLSRTSRFPLEIAGAPSLGANAKVVERISLEGSATLVIESELTAPELLTAPFKITTRYVREPGYVGRELAYCADSDRLVDRDTGALRFDLTPPADLPPPSKLAPAAD